MQPHEHEWAKWARSRDLNGSDAEGFFGGGARKFCQKCHAEVIILTVATGGNPVAVFIPPCGSVDSDAAYEQAQGRRDRERRP
jgi:hypothetical protein